MCQIFLISGFVLYFLIKFLHLVKINIFADEHTIPVARCDHFYITSQQTYVIG